MTALTRIYSEHNHTKRNQVCAGADRRELACIADDAIISSRVPYTDERGLVTVVSGVLLAQRLKGLERCFCEELHFFGSGSMIGQDFWLSLRTLGEPGLPQ